MQIAAKCAGQVSGIGSISKSAFRTPQSVLIARRATGGSRRFHRRWGMTGGIDHALGKLDSLIKEASSQVPASGNATSAAAAAASAAAVRSNGVQTPSDRVPHLAAELRTLFSAALEQAYPGIGIQPIIAQTGNPKFGDYQCNNAMALFGKLKGQPNAPKNPRAVGEAIQAALPAHPAVKSTSIAGPGFVNVIVSDSWLGERIDAMLVHGIGSWAPVLAEHRVVVDFSSPNVAKEMHVGHLRSTILGDTICKMLEFCGCDIVRLNHVGDWGTQFGMLTQHMSEMRPGGLADIGQEDISDLLKLYKESKKRFDEEEDFKGRAREAVTKLQSGDPAFLAAWKLLCEISRKDFEKIYTRLKIHGLTERGESFYNPMLQDVVADLVDRDIATDSNGATCIFIEGEQAPLMIRKSDGGFGYGTTDMAAITHRIRTEKADWVIYVTDEGQAGHFKLVFAAARIAGILPADPSEHPRVSHVGFGLVLGEDGKRFRTRASEVVRLVDLLDEAKARCQETIKERRAERNEPISEEELEEASNAMGYGAVKYADLKNQRLTNYKFNFDQMLNLTGNTAVYLLYAHARIAGIIRKSSKDINELARASTVKLTHESERPLALHIVRFPEVLEIAIAELAPHRLTEYLYELSEVFNSFYRDCKVVDSPEEDSRLLLCEATAVVMRQCFSLLGITPLYRI